MMRRLILGGIFFALVVVAACTSFSTESTPTFDAGSAVDAGGAPATSGRDDAGPVDAGPEPLSIISPYRDGGLAYPRPIAWTIAALDDAVIYYTTDGTPPNPTSNHGTGAVVLRDLPDGTVISWTIGPHTVVHSYTVHVDGREDSGPAQQAGYIFESFRFTTTTSPITTVKAGVASISVHAGAQIWNGAACPGCIDVLTMGIDKGAACLGAGLPQRYPGANFSDREFTIPVPAKAGTYPIRVGFAEVYDCDAGLKSPLSDVQIGTLVVE